MNASLAFSMDSALGGFSILSPPNGRMLAAVRQPPAIFPPFCALAAVGAHEYRQALLVGARTLGLEQFRFGHCTFSWLEKTASGDCAAGFTKCGIFPGYRVSSTPV